MVEEILTNITLFKNILWMEDYAFRMERWSEGEKWGPMRIDAELHRRCNLNCKMCARRTSSKNLTKESKKIEMSTKRWVELVRESAKIHTKVWNISGLSEPMCKPKMLFAVMQAIKAHDMFGELTTNGTLWSEEQIKKAVKMGWDSICVSIDSPDAETHDSQRGEEGSFEKAVKTVKLFRKWRDKLNREVPVLTINVVLSKLNYNKLPEMVKLTHNLGADAIFVEPMTIYTELGASLKLKENQIKELPTYINQAKELAEEYNIANTISCITPEKEFQEDLVRKEENTRKILLEDSKKYEDPILSIPCYYPWFFLMIRADGSAIHCGECKNKSDNVRNKPLIDVWLSDVLEGIRKKFKQGKLPKYCKNCRANVIEDMREMRRSMKNFKDREYLETRILDLLKENMNLKRESARLRMEKGKSKKEINRYENALKHERELMRYKNSLSYRIGKSIGNTTIGKAIKRLFGIYV